MIKITECVIGLSIVAGHFSLCLWLFGQTAACVILGVQVVVGLWMVYGFIRAPTME